MTGLEAVAVFGSSKTAPGSAPWSAAEKVGRSLAEAGLAVITGGYSGTMEAVSRGASEAGGHVIGVTAPAVFPHRSGANPYVAEEIQAPDLAERIGTMLRLAAGAVALPGSIGTATELLLAWNINFIRRRNHLGGPLPTVAVGSAWREVVAALIESVGAEPGDVHLVNKEEVAVTWLLDQLDIHRTKTSFL